MFLTGFGLMAVLAVLGVTFVALTVDTVLRTSRGVR